MFAKRFFVVLMTLILAISLCNVSVFAQENTNLQCDYKVIEVNGKNVKVSTRMSQEEQDKLVELVREFPTLNTEGVFESVENSVTTFGEEDKVVESKESRVIPGSLLELQMVKSDVSTSTRKRYNIQAIALWKGTPSFQNEDQFALSWAGDFAAVNYSSAAYWKMRGISGTKKVDNALTKITPNAGIAYNYLCGRNSPSAPYDPWYVQINVTLEREKGSGNAAANVVAAYAHKTVGVSGIGVSFSATGPTFSVSGGTKYEEASPTSTVIYY